jgi:hypothetical protein
MVSGSRFPGLAVPSRCARGGHRLRPGSCVSLKTGTQCEGRTTAAGGAAQVSSVGGRHDSDMKSENRTCRLGAADNSADHMVHGPQIERFCAPAVILRTLGSCGRLHAERRRSGPLLPRAGCGTPGTRTRGDRRQDRPTSAPVKWRTWGAYFGSGRAAGRRRPAGWCARLCGYRVAGLARGCRRGAGDHRGDLRPAGAA